MMIFLKLILHELLLFFKVLCIYLLIMYIKRDFMILNVNNILNDMLKFYANLGFERLYNYNLRIINILNMIKILFLCFSL